MRAGRVEDATHPGAEMLAAGEFVLGRTPEPGAPTVDIPDWMRDGSFQVIRRLAQDVPSWWAQVARQADPAEAELLAAKLIGRWRSGAPLAHHPARDPGAARGPLSDNEFDYADDPLGHKTPRFCHIRKMLPRDDRFQHRHHRLLRRGIPFGPPFDPAAGPGHGLDTERGLLFIAYMASIERQYEFLQRNWANLATFPSVVDHVQPADDGPDPVIGAGGAAVRLRRANRPDAQLDLSRFVHTTGALYSFTPSASALALLAGERT